MTIRSVGLYRVPPEIFALSELEKLDLMGSGIAVLLPLCSYGVGYPVDLANRTSRPCPKIKQI
jgi:hypothetical protein